MSGSGQIRPVKSEHAPLLLKLIKELADFEKSPIGSVLTEQQLAEDIRTQSIEGFLLFADEQPDAEVMGMTLFHTAYSTWQGKFLNMTDLFVRSPFRRQGHGKRLLQQVARVAKERGMPGIRWIVMSWNKEARNFYEQEQAVNLTESDGWMIYRLTGDAMERLATIDS